LAAPGLSDAPLEQRWLRVMIHAADAASAVDSKQRCLRRLLARIGGEPAIVFTEYRDTLLQLAAALPPSMLLHGGMSGAERAEIQTRFNEHGGLLLATDAAAEGLNLQRRCRVVVNYELPWNPARLEQRIGRVDRIGQLRPVHAITLVARDTAEDLVIANLARRLARVVAALGERDRLGAFLTDARTARLVIAGSAEAPPDAPALFQRDPEAYREDAAAAAGRLSCHRSTGAAAIGASRILVGAVRASRGLPRGIVVVVRAIARTPDGALVASRVSALHVPRAAVKPRSPREARNFAAPVLAAIRDFRDVETAAWFSAASVIHERSIGRRLQRERALLAQQQDQPAVQPGLFDRRALRAAGHLSNTEHARRREHHERIAALERARGLDLACEPVAVLIAWN
jgi:hypothetical protein